jgi:hypothetical protein
MDVPKVRRALADPARFLAEMERQEAREASPASGAGAAPGAGTDAPDPAATGNHESPSLSTASTK